MSTSSAVPPRPALLTITSMRPCSATTVSMSASTCSCTVTSQTTALTPSSAAVSFSRRSCQSLTTTVAPSSTQRLAVAKPMPVPAAAVTTTTFSASSPCAGGYVGASGMSKPIEDGGRVCRDALEQLGARREVVQHADDLTGGHHAEVGPPV